MSRFMGKTIWITGAQTPIGKAVALRCAAEGANLLLSGVSTPPEGLCLGEGQSCSCYADNPLTEADAAQALALVSHLDILVTANRKVKALSILEAEAEDFDDIIDENLTSVFIAARAAAGKIGRGNKGAIVFIGSIHGDKPTGSTFLHSVANGGLNMLTKEAALDLGRSGIRVNLLRAGPTEGDDAVFTSELSGIYHDVESKIPRSTPATAQEIAAAALMLCADDASFINGAILTADGGFVSHYMDADMDTRWATGFGGER